MLAPSTRLPAGAGHLRPEGSSYQKSSSNLIRRSAPASSSHSVLGLPEKDPNSFGMLIPSLGSEVLFSASWFWRPTAYLTDIELDLCVSGTEPDSLDLSC